jgi:DNA-directed RNA polymerase specialized sigma24 family protein
MDANPAPRPKRFLTKEAFGAFLLWLSPNQEQAAGKYLEIRQTLVKYFVRKGCAHSEDLSDRTLDRVALIVQHEPEKYPVVIALCCGVARRVWLEYLREAVLDPLEDENLPQNVFIEEDFSEDEFRCLDACLQELPVRDRELITEYHRFQGRDKIEIRKQMAETQGGLNRLRITTCRIRSRLHACIHGCIERSALNSNLEGGI